MLERVPNPGLGKNYVVRFTCPEFTSLCPLTGQPDFAHIVIDYIPRRLDRREQVAEAVPRPSSATTAPFTRPAPCRSRDRLVALLDPVWLRIGGYWYPRGGMPIDVFWQTGAPPEGAWIPDQGVAAYRGRG